MVYFSQSPLWETFTTLVHALKHVLCYGVRVIPLLSCQQQFMIGLDDSLKLSWLFCIFLLFRVCSLTLSIQSILEPLYLSTYVELVIQFPEVDYKLSFKLLVDLALHMFCWIKLRVIVHAIIFYSLLGIF